MDFENITKEQVNKIFGLVMDSKAQDELMNNITDKDYWMLGFVFDSELLKRLEKYSERLILEEKLISKNNLEKINKV
jgi:hypothetical protein